MKWFKQFSLLSLSFLVFAGGSALAADQKVIRLLDQANKKVNQGAVECAPDGTQKLSNSPSDAGLTLCEGLNDEEKFKYADQFDLNLQCPGGGNVSLSLAGHMPKNGDGILFTATSNPSPGWNNFVKSASYQKWKAEDANLKKGSLWVGKSQEQWLSSMSVNLSLKNLFAPFPATGAKRASVGVQGAENLVNWHNAHASDRGLDQRSLIPCSTDYVVEITPKCTMNFSDESNRGRYIALLKAMYEYQEATVTGIEPVIQARVVQTLGARNMAPNAPNPPVGNVQQQPSAWVQNSNLNSLMAGSNLSSNLNMKTIFDASPGIAATDMTNLQPGDPIKVTSLNSAKNGLPKVLDASGKLLSENQILSYYTVQVANTRGTDNLLKWEEDRMASARETYKGMMPDGVELKLVPYTGTDKKLYVAVVYVKKN